MVVEQFADAGGTLVADPGCAAVGVDVGPTGNDEQGLLRGVEEMDEEIAVDVPCVA
jgi:hypothetical protein